MISLTATISRSDEVFGRDTGYDYIRRRGALGSLELADLVAKRLWAAVFTGLEPDSLNIIRPHMQVVFREARSLSKARLYVWLLLSKSDTHFHQL